MPRIDQNRSLAIPYVPGNPPAPDSPGDQILRAVWEEFTRISQGLVDLDRPVSASVTGSDNINVGAALSYLRLLDASPTTDWLNPGGTFNTATGVYTFAQEGLYLLIIRMQVATFSTSGGAKSYSPTIRMTHTHAAGGANTVKTFSAGGMDDSPVTAIGVIQLPFQQGDTVFFDGGAVHANKTGTAAATTTLTITRQSGVGNAG